VNERFTPVPGPAPDMLTTVRVKRFSVPAEAVREDLRDAVLNERLVRATVIGLWSTAAFLLGVLIAIAR
jgi:hypothetical protein